ncbi:uncharacterized protein VTP21DRAFT_7698 [Calcarisporiella thermophila]|uniref:uncharacterized protein n=1 Tax=Calcarisporiella thermophila TaxID=911321 RepID=UPI0037434534
MLLDFGLTSLIELDLDSTGTTCTIRGEFLGHRAQRGLAELIKVNSKFNIRNEILAEAIEKKFLVYSWSIYKPLPAQKNHPTVGTNLFVGLIAMVFKGWLASLLIFQAMSVAHTAGHGDSANPLGERFVFNTLATGKDYPLLPEEYVTYFRQHKWDRNGFGLSHLASGVIWSSAKRKAVRVDSAQYGWRSNNATERGPTAGGIHISTFDFNRQDGNATNVIFTRDSMEKQDCVTYNIPAASTVFQALPATFLKESRASFSGEAMLEQHGLCDKWVAMFGETPVTFYFDRKGAWVRVDFVTPSSQASVVNEFYSMDATQPILDDIFAGFNRCPTTT